MPVRVFWGGAEIPGPCSVGPLRRETSLLELREGGAPWLVRRSPELTRCLPLTIERDLGADRSFDAWAALVAPFPIGPTPEPVAFRKEVRLEYGAGCAAHVFRLASAWPVAYEVVDGEGAMRERLTLVCDGFERLAE
ncbi:MAG: hypothetical protein AB7I59_29290 [Geminicoccaceae bacterium]